MHNMSRLELLDNLEKLNECRDTLRFFFSCASGPQNSGWSGKFTGGNDQMRRIL